MKWKSLQPLLQRSLLLAALISFILHQQWETSSVKLLQPPAGWVEWVKTGSRGRNRQGGWEGTWWKKERGRAIKKKRGKKPTRTGCALRCFCPIGQRPTQSRRQLMTSLCETQRGEGGASGCFLSPWQQVHSCSVPACVRVNVVQWLPHLSL